MIAETIRGMQPHHDDGICNTVLIELAQAGLISREDGWVNTAISQCLADGFEHYSGDQNYPIQSGTGASASTAYEITPVWALWDTRSPYGRNRHAAWAHIQARADRFTLNGTELEYTP